MAVHLTETVIQAETRKAADRGRFEVADLKQPGLRLRITPTGGRSWTLACRDLQGRMRRFALGEYPKMSIAKARGAASDLRADIRKGADPIAERKRQRAIGRDARDGVGTLTALLDLYAEQRGREQKSWPECRRRMDSVFAPFLTTSVMTLKMIDLQMQADRWEARQSAAAAVRYIRPVLKWAAQRAYAPAELCQIVTPVAVRRRRRVLTQDELGALLPVLRTFSGPYAVALRFMLLTLTRREETGLARWRDVDLGKGVWTISETKNGEPHTVPLSKQAIDLLRSIKDEKTERDTGRLIFATSSGAQLANWDRETKRIARASGTLGWTRHDLRRTGATMLGDMGELPDIVEAALNHVSIRSALAAAYNQSRYRPRVAQALQRLADALDKIETGAQADAPSAPRTTGTSFGNQQTVTALNVPLGT